jgi:alkylation response protein AidB-like acyl-CoA dehydrogenase
LLSSLRYDRVGLIDVGDALVLIALNDDARIAYIDQADAVIAQRAEQLYLVERDHLAIVSHQSVDGSRRLGSIAWETSNGIPLSNGTEATTSLATSFNAGALGTAAQLVGLGQTMLDMAVEYAKVRTQFGKAIGSFQAIQHQLCDALLQLEFARPQVYRAAWSLATGYDEQDVDVSMAKAYASAAAEKVAKVALQVHGAIGYTTEYDLHLWMKRAWCLSRIYGDAGWHRRRIGAELLNQ